MVHGWNLTNHACDRRFSTLEESVRPVSLVGWRPREDGIWSQCWDRPVTAWVPGPLSVDLVGVIPKYVDFRALSELRNVHFSRSETYLQAFMLIWVILIIWATTIFTKQIIALRKEFLQCLKRTLRHQLLKWLDEDSPATATTRAETVVTRTVEVGTQCHEEDSLSDEFELSDSEGAPPVRDPPRRRMAPLPPRTPLQIHVDMESPLLTMSRRFCQASVVGAAPPSDEIDTPRAPLGRSTSHLAIQGDEMVGEVRTEAPLGVASRLSVNVSELSLLATPRPATDEATAPARQALGVVKQTAVQMTLDPVMYVSSHPKSHRPPSPLHGVCIPREQSSECQFISVVPTVARPSPRGRPSGDMLHSATTQPPRPIDDFPQIQLDDHPSPRGRRDIPATDGLDRSTSPSGVSIRMSPHKRQRTDAEQPPLTGAAKRQPDAGIGSAEAAQSAMPDIASLPPKPKVPPLNLRGRSAFHTYVKNASRPLLHERSAYKQRVEAPSEKTRGCTIFLPTTRPGFLLGGSFTSRSSRAADYYETARTPLTARLSRSRCCTSRRPSSMPPMPRVL